MTERLLVGEGADAVVWRSSSDGSVRKSYVGQVVAERARLAATEYTALLQAQDALHSISRVTCPTPYFVDHERGELVMEYCGGDQLDVAIADRHFDEPAHVADLARALGDAMIALTDRLPITQLDFSIRNTLISEDRQQIVLIDFTKRSILASLPEGTLGIECALASFLASAITYQVRRSSFTQTRQARRLRQIATTLVRSRYPSQQVDVQRVRAIAWQHFWRQSNNRGWMRFMWFHTCGALMFWFLLCHMTRETVNDTIDRTDRAQTE